MRGLIYLFNRFGALLLFIALEILCFILIINFNNSQREIYLNSTNILSGKMQDQMERWTDFFSLYEINDSLSNENAKLKTQLVNMLPTKTQDVFQDSTFQYELISAKIVNQTLHLRNNYLTLNKGKIDGIKAGMGVIDEEGIVGIVAQASDRYSRVISLLNSETKISVRIKNKDYFGSLNWKSRNPEIMTLENIPKHVNIGVGDTVITSGYSTIFPPDIPIGYIEKFDVPRGDSFYSIQVRVKNDFASLHFVYVVNNNYKINQSEVESDE